MLRTFLCGIVLLSSSGLWAQWGIGAAAGYSHNEHWYRSNVGVGIVVERAFANEPWRMRATGFLHAPADGRHAGTFNGDPQPTSFLLGNGASTTDRYWSAATDVEADLRGFTLPGTGIRSYVLVGLGFRHEHYAYRSRFPDASTGRIEESEGTLLRDRFAHRIGFGLRYGTRPSEVFLELVCDAISFTAEGKEQGHMDLFEELGGRFGFIHALNLRPGSHATQL
ncbi:MAG: hypothetical protein ABI599_04960 [Flavobacteriales bacterium]